MTVNGFLHCLLAAVLCSGAVGCATTSESTRTSASPAEQTIATDSVYVGQVERIARRRGIEVQWVNPPTKRQVASIR